MGNCCKTASSMEWGGEDWSSLRSKKKNSSSKVFDEDKLNKENLTASDLLSVSSSSFDHENGKIKIKITKRELEVLLGEMEKQKQKQHEKVLSAEEVLIRLMKAREHNHHHKPWGPELESIPEVN